MNEYDYGDEEYDSEDENIKRAQGSVNRYSYPLSGLQEELLEKSGDLGPHSPLLDNNIGQIRKEEFNSAGQSFMDNPYLISQILGSGDVLKFGDSKYPDPVEYFLRL
jgi:hypothetical protein